MRVPYVIAERTLKAYEPSELTLHLLGELGRQLYPEDFTWDSKLVPSLVTYCIRAIAKNFENKPILDELYLADRDNLLEFLPTDLPLELIVPLIDDKYYWKRCYADKFGKCQFSSYPKFTWKAAYIEKYMQEIIENLQPQYSDEESIDDVLKLCNPYIEKIKITQLQAWKPPLTMSQDEIPEIYPIDHISFEPILSVLEGIIELDIVYGVNKIGDNFNWNMFKVSVTDCKRLGKAILNLKHLKIFRLHRSRLEDDHVRGLLKELIKNTTLLELDLSHCLIRDKGALCVAKFMTVHPNLIKLRLCNNRIGALGGKGLGYALTHDNCCPLIHLDLRLNPLEHDGTMGILRALVRTHKLQELLLSGCYFEDETSLRVAQMLGLNTSLKILDVTNNWFDEEASDAILERMPKNRVLEWFDLRQTDIPEDRLDKVKKYLTRNRSHNENIEEDISTIVQETEYVQEDPEMQQIHKEQSPEQTENVEETEKQIKED